MTDYTDFIRDFPVRCGEVLHLFYDQAHAKNREVTLLIMTAAAAFVIPFERLRSGTEHPAHDREKFPQQAKLLDAALGKPFLALAFHNGDSGSWSIGKRPRPKLVDPSPLSKEKSAIQVLAILRNALAHGNLWTIPGTGSDIRALIFRAEDKKDKKVIGYKYVYISPTDFRDFLLKWCAFLKKEKLQAGVVSETLALAA